MALAACRTTREGKKGGGRPYKCGRGGGGGGVAMQKRREGVGLVAAGPPLPFQNFHFEGEWPKGGFPPIVQKRERERERERFFTLLKSAMLGIHSH